MRDSHRMFVGRRSPAQGEWAEAVNLWIGSSRSVTSFHHDPYVILPGDRD